MLLEMRTYDFAPGAALDYVRLFGREGIPIITRYLPLVAYWVTEAGELNRVHHIWAYSNLDDRMARRSRMLADPAWAKDFLPRGLSMIRRQASRLLEPMEMEDTFATAVAEADRVHPPLQAEASPLAEGLLTLAINQSQCIGGILHARVCCGESTGSVLTLSKMTAGRELPVHGACDLLRPTRFSPFSSSSVQETGA
ncbi:NIPSNAP family protein [Rhizobium laguerreae]|uniref:NIPSNAP family protein n=1 Tax=Rhizobium laguerreae TaxID=1076926 RepID=UPI001C8FE4EE|nr:NIPSNAP family protein [Rhizobium laguerreae]MBY3217745.1 NIPSNAP family protein [Rhizobium laguerreae]